jgi:hypothetical protein
MESHRDVREIGRIQRNSSWRRRDSTVNVRAPEENARKEIDMTRKSESSSLASIMG